jgi:hypothetical protein
VGPTAAASRCNNPRQRLDAIPDVGLALATALVASIADPKAVRATQISSLNDHGEFRFSAQPRGAVVPDIDKT